MVNSEYRPIELGDRFVFSEENVGPGSTASFGCIQVGCIGVGSENHDAGAKDDAIVWICGYIIKNLVNGSDSVFSCTGLLGANGAESCKQFVVDGAGKKL